METKLVCTEEVCTELYEALDAFYSVAEIYGFKKEGPHSSATNKMMEIAGAALSKARGK